jgi:hypothetical protein
LAGLHRLVRDLLPRAPALPAPQRQAVEAAFGHHPEAFGHHPEAQAYLRRDCEPAARLARSPFSTSSCCTPGRSSPTARIERRPGPAIQASFAVVVPLRHALPGRSFAPLVRAAFALPTCGKRRLCSAHR